MPASKIEIVLYILFEFCEPIYAPFDAIVSKLAKRVR